MSATWGEIAAVAVLCSIPLSLFSLLQWSRITHDKFMKRKYEDMGMSRRWNKYKIPKKLYVCVECERHESNCHEPDQMYWCEKHSFWMCQDCFDGDGISPKGSSLKQYLDELKETTKESLKIIRNALGEAGKECRHLHHEKSDYHTYNEPCPVEKRIKEALK